MTQLVKLTIEDGIGTVVLDNPPVNALSYQLRVELRDVLAQALADDGVRAIVLCCAGRTFIAGADIKEFGKTPLLPGVPEIIEFVGAAEKPIVAALHGSALGGGLELALACSHRVAPASATLGFPEVTLGILPGGGGTQRLPRLVGLAAALEMIVGGLPISAERALALGLVDAVVTGEIRTEAQVFAARLASTGALPRRTSARLVPPEDPHKLAEIERTTRERARGQLAPLHCLQAVRAAAELPFAEGLKRERELFAELMASSQSRALRHVFFGEREVGRGPTLPEGTTARDVRRAGVVGAGALGTSLAIALADAGIPVTLIDISEEKLERALATGREHFARKVRAKRLDEAGATERTRRLQPTLSYAELGQADVVFEAVNEDPETKRTAFAELARICKPGAVLATTTSHLDVNRLAASTSRPQDVVGIHFCGPPCEARVIETARATHTAPDAWATALKLGKALGKLSIATRASPGGVGARMLAPLLREALFMLEEGASRAQVDRTLEEFGFAKTPLPGEVRHWDPELAPVLAARGKARGGTPKSIADDEIVERCLFALVNEGAQILAEGIALRAIDIDMLWVRGYGFPAHRGGPLFYADALGLPHVHRTILGLQRRLGPHEWTPSPLLERLAVTQGSFYDSAN